jgi:hypothetical protein
MMTKTLMAPVRHRVSKAESAGICLCLTGALFLSAAQIQAAGWVNVTGNLAKQPSECGNLCRLFPVPHSDKVIAGVAGAGLWATTNGGALWIKLGDPASRIRNRPQQILFDPADANVFWEVGIYTAPGVFRTTDGGATFSPVGGISHNDGLAIDFTDPERRTLIATGHEAHRKVYKSTDGGASFVDIGASFPAGTKHTSGCFLIDALIYVVACAGWGQGEGGVWRSNDGGTNWTRVCDQIPNGGGPVLRTSEGLFFWGSANGGRLLKGSGDGARWSVVSAPGAKSVSPIELPDGRIATLGQKGILASADEGATWNTLAEGPPKPTDYHVDGGLVYHPAGGAFYAWFWDCGAVVRPDAIWRYEMPLSPK